MSKTHELKTLPVYFDAVLRGDKTFEVRKNDRDFQTGDVLVLREYDPVKTHPSAAWEPGGPPPLPVAPGDYTGRALTVVASYVLHDTWEKFGLARGHVVIGFNGPMLEQAEYTAGDLVG